MSWHRHSWQKMDVEYNEPLPPKERTTALLSGEYQMQAHGFTNITWQCRRCPKVKVEQHVGKVSL